VFDLAVIAFVAACFVFIFVLRWGLERVWCRPPTSSGWSCRCSCSSTSCTRSSAASGC